MSFELDFEAPVSQLTTELERQQRSTGHEDQVDALERDIEQQLRELYEDLTPWQTVQVARHRQRPYTLDYAKLVFTDFVELHGDRRFGDDRAILGGPALLDGTGVMIVGHQKGRDTKESLEHNFGMPNPEGYRKAIRLFQQAEKLNLPIITFIDTPGANPSLPAEERGQAQAIAEAIAVMLALRVPTIAVVTGEGGSGGALAIAVADRILMLEHSIFTVASPEGAASILWRDAAEAPQAAEAMRITGRDLVELGVVDGIVPEPVGGAHRDHVAAAHLLREELTRTVRHLRSLPTDELIRTRREKYRRIGAFT
jgi:acetyl-CoA carboxylase carboxyl transferase subunit alpha